MRYQCLFDPSSYDGSGKMNVTFGIPEATATALEEVEKAIGTAAGCELNPSVKRKEGYPPSFRTKWTVERIQFVDEGGQPTEAPESLRGLRLKIIVSPRSTYHQSKMAGIIWDLVGVQVLGKVEAKQVRFRVKGMPLLAFYANGQSGVVSSTGAVTGPQGPAGAAGATGATGATGASPFTLSHGVASYAGEVDVGGLFASGGSNLQGGVSMKGQITVLGDSFNPLTISADTGATALLGAFSAPSPPPSTGTRWPGLWPPSGPPPWWTGTTWATLRS